MNRTIYFFLGLAVIAGSASCGKTNVRKLTGDWTVTYEEQSIDKSYDDTTNRNTLLLMETTATSTTEFGTAGATTPYVESGTVTRNNFVIREDGTWTWDKDYTTSDPNYSTRHQYLLSGSWSFVDKSGRHGEGFGRRERIAFHLWSQKVLVVSTLISTGEEQTPAMDYTQTFANGRMELIYVVETSSKKELQLVSEGDKVYVSSLNSEPVQTFKTLSRLSLKQQ